MPKQICGKRQSKKSLIYVSLINLLFVQSAWDEAAFVAFQ